jgi:hypothetical protein
MGSKRVELSSSIAKHHFLVNFQEKLHRGDYLRTSRKIFIEDENSSSIAISVYISHRMNKKGSVHETEEIVRLGERRIENTGLTARHGRHFTDAT